MLDDASIAPSLATLSPEGPGRALSFAVNTGLVMERVASAYARSREVRVALASHYARLNDQVEKSFATDPTSSPEQVRYKSEKWNTLLTPGAEFVALAIEGGDVRATRALQYQLAIGIIEVADIDRLAGIEQNTDLGLALAASTVDMMPWVDGDSNFKFPFAKGWFDAYVSWYLNHASQHGHAIGLQPLLVPSVLCTSEHTVRESWLLAQAAALKMAMVFAHAPSRINPLDAALVDLPKSARRTAATIAASHSDLPTPSACCGHGSLFKLWKAIWPYGADGLLGISAQMDGPQFAMYLTLICWISVSIAGLGSEIIIGTSIMESVMQHKFGVAFWHAAQLFFALMLTVAFVGQSAFGLPFLVSRDLAVDQQLTSCACHLRSIA